MNKVIQNLEESLEEQKISYFQILKYSSIKEQILMTLGLLAAAINGATTPVFSIIYGDMVDTFSKSGDELLDQAKLQAIQCVIVAGITMLLSLIMFATWIITGQIQSLEFRKRYFAAILKQDVEWFDTINSHELSNKIAQDTLIIQEAISEKVPTFIMTISTTFFGFLIGYIYGWQLALVVSSSLPAISMSTYLFTVIVQTSERETSNQYLEIGTIVEQALSSIKTIKMFDGEHYEVEKFKKNLLKASAKTIKYQLYQGMAFGFLWAALIWTYSLGFWYGAKLISEQTYNNNSGREYQVADVTIVFFTILIGGTSLGQAGPCLQSFVKGKEAFGRMKNTLDRKSKIIIQSNPKQPKTIESLILLNNVRFSYPNKPEKQILKGINMEFPAGKKIAIVGESGCGKSTIIQLIERFYDCDQGEIIFGGVNVKDMDLLDLRQRISLVGQEPQLFATSIRNNLLYCKSDATETELIDALKKANAWDFISRMEKGLETYVGIGGNQLSGGQKQRIAIARAILKKPQVLLLDEATSALDRTNERLIQEILDEVSQGITTIIVAHRLSTIYNSDIIYVIENGIITEQGNYEELMMIDGKFKQVVVNQIKQEDKEKQNLEIQTKLDGQIENKIDIIFKQELNVEKQASAQYNNNNTNEGEQLNQISEAKLSRLFKFKSQGKICLILGILTALLNGCTFPAFSLLFANMITNLLKYNPTDIDDQCLNKFKNPTKEICDLFKSQQSDELRLRTNQISLWLFLIGVAMLLLWTLTNYFLSYYGQKLTCQLRIDTYRKLLRMPISYFDEIQNSASALSNKIFVECNYISGFITSYLGLNITNIGILLCGLIISLVSSWQMTLVQIGLIPFSYIGGILSAKYFQGYSDLTNEAFMESGKIIMEAVTNIKTVVSFCNEDIILNEYSKQLRIPYQQTNKKGILVGLAFGFSMMQELIITAIIFYVGAILYQNEIITVEEMFKSWFAIYYATQSAGNNSAFAGDLGSAKSAILKVFKILDCEDEFEKEEKDKRLKLTSEIQGCIYFNNITFKYQNRDQYIFQNFNLTIQKGQKVAFVGTSGCGKSTLLQLLLRFYEPSEGFITIDGIDIRDYDIRFLRQQFGVVQQEPSLFFGTVRENIQYNLKNITNEQIQVATQQANAYEFIDQFDQQMIQKEDIQQGLQKQVGNKGSQISGGQKQKIALARTFLRNQNIFLFDEATSALDATNETIVLNNINQIQQGKTSITIAHKISTIKNSDLILVLKDGQIIESGDYQTLSTTKGSFYRLEQGIIE